MVRLVKVARVRVAAKRAKIKERKSTRGAEVHLGMNTIQGRKRGVQPGRGRGLKLSPVLRAQSALSTLVYPLIELRPAAHDTNDARSFGDTNGMVL